LSYFHEPNQVGWIDDGLVTINSIGLRGDEPIRPKTASIYRILVLGDSITLGWGVNDDETFCCQLQQRLNEGTPARHVEVINAGVAGYSTIQEAALLRRLAPELRPDLVLVGFYWNDLLMSPKGRSSAPAENVAVQPPTSDLGEGRVLQMTPPAHWWEKTLRCSRAAFVAGRALKRVCGAGEWNASYSELELELLKGANSPDIEQRWQRVREEFGNIGEIAKEYECDLGIIVLPSRQQVAGDFPDSEILPKVTAIANELGCEVIDPLPRLHERRREIDSLYIAYDWHHPTCTGHQIISDSIANDLKDDNRSFDLPLFTSKVPFPPQAVRATP
jgi:hypothetical protein